MERNFADLDEALDWVDRNQIARRNLTDEQFAVVIGRIYERRKKAPHRPREGERNNVVNFTTFSGSAATAKAVASEFGVGEKTVRRAADFARAVEAIEQRSPERVYERRKKMARGFEDRELSAGHFDPRRRIHVTAEAIVNLLCDL